MRGITSAPMNWAIDYGQNRQGEIYGNALANVGGLTGNAIMEFARKRKEQDEKKAKEEQAVQFLVKQGVKEEEAKTAVKGVGVDNFLRFRQIDQNQQELNLRKQQVEQERDMAIQKAQQATQERNAILQAVQASRQAQMPEAGPMSVLPRGGVSGKLQTDGPSDVNRFMETALVGGAPINAVNDTANSLLAANRANKRPTGNVRYETEPITGSVIMVPEDGSPQNLGRPDKPDDGPKLKPGDKKVIEVNGRKVSAIFTGGRSFVDEATLAPLYIDNTDPLTGARTASTPNPLVFGTEAQQPTAANPIVPAPSAEDKYADPQSLLNAVRSGEITTAQAREIAKKKGFK